MAFAAVDSTSEPRAFSMGPLKVQLMTYSAISGDTTGTITADKLYLVKHCFIDGGLKFTAAPTFSANVATLAFTNPAANIFGTLILVGN